MTEPLLTFDERVEINAFWMNAGCPKLTAGTIEGRRLEVAAMIVDGREAAYKRLAAAILDHGNLNGHNTPTQLTADLVNARRLRRAARLTAAVAQRDANNAKGTTP